MIACLFHLILAISFSFASDNEDPINPHVYVRKVRTNVEDKFNRGTLTGSNQFHSANVRRSTSSVNRTLNGVNAQANDTKPGINVFKRLVAAASRLFHERAIPRLLRSTQITSPKNDGRNYEKNRTVQADFTPMRFSAKRAVRLLKMFLKNKPQTGRKTTSERVKHQTLSEIDANQLFRVLRMISYLKEFPKNSISQGESSFKPSESHQFTQSNVSIVFNESYSDPTLLVLSREGRNQVYSPSKASPTRMSRFHQLNSDEEKPSNTKVAFSLVGPGSSYGSSTNKVEGFKRELVLEDPTNEQAPPSNIVIVNDNGFGQNIEGFAPGITESKNNDILEYPAGIDSYGSFGSFVEKGPGKIPGGPELNGCSSPRSIEESDSSICYGSFLLGFVLGTGTIILISLVCFIAYLMMLRVRRNEKSNSFGKRYVEPQSFSDNKSVYVKTKSAPVVNRMKNGSSEPSSISSNYTEKYKSFKQAGSGEQKYASSTHSSGFEIVDLKQSRPPSEEMTTQRARYQPSMASSSATEKMTGRQPIDGMESSGKKSLSTPVVQSSSERSTIRQFKNENLLLENHTSLENENRHRAAVESPSDLSLTSEINKLAREMESMSRQCYKELNTP